MTGPQVDRVLKRDAFGRVELLSGPRGLVVRRVACGGALPGSRALARLFLARERRALERLAGLAGVARLVDAPEYAAAVSSDGAAPRLGDVLLRSWIPGQPLWGVRELPSDFFERLEDLVAALHAHGVCHNDLHKEPNVLVGEDRYPALVDFQLSSVHRSRGRTYRTRVGEDLRHVAKHRRTYARGTGRQSASGGAALGRRRSLLARLWMRLGKPVYNFVTRRLLSTSDGEPRRPPGGPWPRWTEPVGPRPR